MKQPINRRQFIVRGAAASAGLYSLTAAGAAETNAPATRPVPVAVAKEATGAKVDESAYRVTLYVDVKGDDARDGLTARTALKTLGAAVAKATESLNQGDGVRVLLAPGVYREGYIVVKGNEMTDTGRNALLIIEGVAKGQVTISGAVVEGWAPETWKEQAVKDGLHTYQHAWPYEFEIQKQNKPEDILISFREMVILNGRMLKQEGAAEKLIAGCFYIDRENKTISLTLGRELLPSDVVEIAEKESLLTVHRKNNFVLRNCDFSYCNPHIMGGKRGCLEDPWGRAVEICTHDVGGGTNTNLLIEDCSFSQHNAAGLRVIASRDVTLRRCTANRNGWKGMGLSGSRNVLLEDCETSYNAWRQLWSTSRFHDSGGIKIIPGSDTVTLRRHVALSNTVTHGIWFDMNNTNVVLDECRVEGQSAPAIYFEMGRGPHLIKNCFIKNGQGIVSRASSNFILEGNHLEADGGVLISLIEDQRSGRRPTIQGFVLRNNQLRIRQGGIFNTIGYWKQFYDTLVAERNTYAFGKAGDGGQGFFDADRKAVSFEEWQKLGFDAGSARVAAGQPAQAE